MADHRCWRCRFKRDAGPRTVRGRVICNPEMKLGGPPPFWMTEDETRRELGEEDTRRSDTCPRFQETVAKKGSA